LQAYSEGVSPHSGGHLSSYYQGIGDFLDSQQQLLNSHDNQTSGINDVSNNINNFVDALRTGLSTGGVYTNTPWLATPSQTNMVNGQYFADLQSRFSFTATDPGQFTTPGYQAAPQLPNVLSTPNQDFSGLSRSPGFTPEVLQTLPR
jgi:hypothetical protein